jgi:hypothetical protein
MKSITISQIQHSDEHILIKVKRRNIYGHTIYNESKTIGLISVVGGRHRHALFRPHLICDAILLMTETSLNASGHIFQSM